MKKIIAVLMLVCLAFVGGCGEDDNYKGSGMTKTAYEKKIAQEKEQKRQEEQKVYEHFGEITSSYNKVLSNTLSFVYEGCEFRNAEWINVSVNNNWYALSKAEKETVVTRCAQTYTGMLGARGLHIDSSNLSVYIRNANRKEVASWNGVRGVSISE